MTLKELEEWIDWCKNRHSNNVYNLQNWNKISIEKRIEIGRHAGCINILQSPDGKTCSVLVI